MRTPYVLALTRALVCLLLGALGLVWLPATSVEAAPSSSAGFVVIVHPSVSLGRLDRRFAANAFLKKASRWPNGDPIVPVDLAASSRTRARFSESVIGRSVSSVRSYWQQIIFAGRGLPPPELEDDAAVVRWVVSRPGAIGYISTGSRVGAARVMALD